MPARLLHGDQKSRKGDAERVTSIAAPVVCLKILCFDVDPNSYLHESCLWAVAVSDVGFDKDLCRKAPPTPEWAFLYKERSFSSPLDNLESSTRIFHALLMVIGSVPGQKHLLVLLAVLQNLELFSDASLPCK